MNSLQQKNVANQPTEPDLALKPARLDFLSSPSQMTMAAVISVLVVLVAWSPSLSGWFLLDDFLHIDYVSRAFNGDWGDFLNNFTSNWAGSDIMKSYRPLASLSIFLDYAIWKTNAWGYHFTNLLLLMGCSIFVGLTTLELTGRLGNRMRATASIWAALLFALCPLQAESTSWIIGRVDLLCTFFYLASVFCFLRYRLVREKRLFHYSIAAFIAALLSKEMAYTLPVVITAAAFLVKEHSTNIESNEYKWKLRTQTYSALLTFWLILLIAFTSRMVLLGTFIGGYGDGGGHSIKSLLATLNNFTNAETIRQILFPVNLDIIARLHAYNSANTIQNILSAAYLGIAGIGSTRIILHHANRKIILFLLIWIAASVLPTFQIWHVSPNMVGSRLFFMGSAPAIILMTLLALPAIDVIKPIWAKFYATAGSILLFTILCVWTVCLQLNQTSWVQASIRTRAFVDSLAKAAQGLPSGKKALLLNLPTDFSGAGMLTRPQYLAFSLKRPFYADDSLAQQVVSIEPPVAGSHDYLWPKKFAASASSSRVFAWKENTDAGLPPYMRTFFSSDSPQSPSGESGLIAWTATSTRLNQGEPASQSSQSMTIDPLSLKLASPTSNDNFGAERELNFAQGKQWIVMGDSGQKFRQSKDGLIVSPGTASVTTLVADLENLDPRRLNVLTLKWKSLIGDCSGMDVCWQADGAVPQNTTSSMPVPAPSINKAADAGSTASENQTRISQVWLGRSKQWTLARNIKRIGLRLPPGDYSLLIRDLTLTQQESASPFLGYDRSANVLDWDASKIEGAKKVELIVLNENKSFDATNPFETSQTLTLASGVPVQRKTLGGLAGKLDAKELFSDKSAYHHVRVQAIDDEGAVLGFPSEPLIIERKNFVSAQ